MIKVKAKSTTDGKDMLLLGLSDENMKRLKDGQPIKFNAKDVGFPHMEIMIFNGRTEAEMYEEICNKKN